MLAHETADQIDPQAADAAFIAAHHMAVGTPEPQAGRAERSGPATPCHWSVAQAVELHTSALEKISEDAGS